MFLRLTTPCLFLAALAVSTYASPALAQTSNGTPPREVVKIVGIGAVKCNEFILQIAASPLAENEFFAWAQGFMNGALVRAPSGVDTGLDLLPSDFGAARQKGYIKEFCAKSPQSDFSDSVISLYRALRTVTRTR